MHAHAYISIKHITFLKTYGQIEIANKKKVTKKIFQKPRPESKKNKCLLKISITLKNLPPIHHVNFEKNIIVSEKSFRKNFF